MEHKDYRLAAIMFTDIVGFSRMMGSDEAGTLQLLRYHNEVITEAAARRNGTVIKTIGDAFLVDFRSTVDALRCAMEIQDTFYVHNKEAGAKTLLLRIGIHLGDIYFFENDALGEGINIASRLQGMARPGCICLSQDVYNQVLNKIEFRAEKLGKVSLKNITKEVHAYEIASSNIEFDPDHNKPRPGFTSELNPAAGEPSPAMEELKQTILDDIRVSGKRPSVAQAIERYGSRGVEAMEVISALADKGFIIKQQTPAAPFASAQARSDSAPRDGQAASSDISKTISRTVEGVLRAIETGVNSFQESNARQNG
ncbi:MAG TPA: adenylate/guanylate cyclase domain-containing protein, partial [Spirochaetales bacterium]|nr:adenylate/guanylate cyclase domain-containing protein [Spirochaetales bacterium]